ncbi:MAG: hypothetical protein ACR2IK_05305 [Chloroflexota bacterium]
MAEQERTPSTRESRDGTGAGDHDQSYQFGHKATTASPHPFTHGEFARLLIVRGRVRAAAEHIDATHDE